MARRLILPLLLLIALAGLLFYVGSERGILFDSVARMPEKQDMSETEIFVSLQIIFALIAAAIVTTIVIWSLLTWLWRLPKRVKKGVGRRRGEQGLAAIEQALLAVESGDGAAALRKAKKAADLLDRPVLTSLISAKAAEISGAHDDAHSHYSSLKDNPETQVAGLHGLARLSKNRGDHAASIEMAKAAFENPKAPAWAFEHLYTAQTALFDWAGALETLATAEKRKLLDKDEIRRRRAVLLAARADGLDNDGQSEDALDLAKRAADLSPGFAPGVALAARLLLKAGQVKKAAHVIEKAWARAPHPALALAYRDLWQDEAPKTKAKKIKHLIKTNANHHESAILAAEQALVENDGVAALSALDKLIHDKEPSARVCALAAQAEGMLGNAVDAGAWQHRAASAPIEADWSDLDPDGAAFNYTNADWQRLAVSYGQTGTLLHPRYEAYKRRRAVASIGEAPKKVKDDPVPPSADDPGPRKDKDAHQDLSDRLENLLDDDSKP